MAVMVVAYRWSTRISPLRCNRMPPPAESVGADSRIDTASNARAGGACANATAHAAPAIRTGRVVRIISLLAPDRSTRDRAWGRRSGAPVDCRLALVVHEREQ